MRRVLVHLGYPKTGTTLLQHAVFPRFAATAGRQVVAVGPRGVGDTPMSYLRFRRTLSGQRPDWFLPRTAWKHLVAEGSHDLVLSDEGPLVSELRRIVSGERPGRFDSRLRWLREQIPADVRISILLTTRTQGRLLPSLLAETHHALTPAARDVRRWIGMALDAASPLHALLDAERFLGRLMASLEATEAHLLPLELLTVDPDQYDLRLSRALGIPVEPSRAEPLNARGLGRDEWATSTSTRGGALRRLGFSLYARRALPLPPRVLLRRSPGDTPVVHGDVHRIHVPTATQERLTRAFGASNDRLLRRFDLDPFRFGYDPTTVGR